MAESDRLGAEDEIVLEVGNYRVTDIESYRVEAGIFTFPCAFGLETGSGVDVGEFLQAIPPRTHFKLSVLGHPQFEGKIDAPNAHGDQNSSILQLQGRDLLAALHRGTFPADQTFEDESPADLFRIAVKSVSLGDIPVIVDDRSSRKTRTGAAIVSLRGPREETPPKKRKRKARVGQTYIDFLQTEFQHAGVFAWQTPGPTGPQFVVSAPDTDQAPLYRIYRLADRTGNVQRWRYRNDTVHRWAELRVYGDSRRGAFKNQGGFVDEEMKGWGYTELRTVHDGHVTTDEEADFYASRKLAESRRNGRQLEYTVSGHTTPTIDGKSRAVWTPNTMVQVDDDVLRIHDVMWLEDVAFERSMGGTFTTLRLMRVEDLKFGGVG